MIDANTFVEELASRIAGALRQRAPEFSKHRLGAVTLDTHPWHKGTTLSVLIETDRDRKWDIGSWEHQYFADLDGSPIINQAYGELQDPTVEGSGRYAPFFRAAAQALCHDPVKDSLNEYSLEPDFELFLADPDDPNEVNYCEEFLGINLLTRKPKTKIVNNLEEALKDPASVLTLAYSYHDTFSPTAGTQIALLTNLEQLNLSSNGLTTLPSCVLSLTNLTELTLDFNSISSLAGLKTLSKLRLLSLRDNGILAPDMLKEIAAIKSLQALRLGHCGLSEVPDAFRTLRFLEEIYLFGNPLSMIPDWLPALPNLKRLGLVDSVSDETKGEIRNRHPHLEIW